MSGPAILDPGFEERTLGTLLRTQAERHPERTFLMSDDRRWSFAEVDAEVDRHAAGLEARGVTAGSTVALILETSARFLFTALALGRLGAVFVPVSLALKGPGARHVLEASRSTALVVDPALRPLAEEAMAGLERPLTIIEVGDLAASGDGVRMPASRASSFDPWSIMFTSGTTGPAKGAVMTHQYWYVVPAELCGPARAVWEDDVFYVSSPMFHAAAWLVQILPALLLGLPVAVDGGFSVSRFWDRVRHYGATQLLTMAATHLWLFKQEPRATDGDNPARVWAPVPLPAELREPFRERFGIEHLWSTYGGTEFMAVANTDVRLPTKPGASGRARPSVDLAVLDDLGRRLPPGEIGELCVRPAVPHAIFQGYVGMPEETLGRCRDLWYHTGDLARIDADGELFFVDRKDDYLRVGGENISSFEIEAAVCEHPDVIEAAAHGVSAGDEALVAEDRVKVWAVVRPGAALEPAELIGFAAQRLPRYAVPRYVELVADLPRTATGRVRKHVLREHGITDRTWDRLAAVPQASSARS